MNPMRSTAVIAPKLPDWVKPVVAGRLATGLLRASAKAPQSKLSEVQEATNPLRPTQGETHGAVVEYERFDPPPEPIPEEYVLRPLYGRGREIWVSDDSTHLHSTPDQQYRECVWRFM